MTRLLMAIFAATLLTSTTAISASHHRTTHRGVQHKAARHAPAMTADSVNAAALNGGNAQDPSLIVKAEVMLDRNHFSPGQIDGRNGDNFTKALSAFEQANGLPPTRRMNAGAWKALVTNGSDKVLKRYKISNADVAGPFDKRIPANLVQMAKLPGLSYKSPREELAEKFHMSEALLAKLNPGVQFDRAGTDIVVADVKPMELHNRRHTVEAAKSAKNDRRTEVVASIVIDKPASDVRAYDKEGKLLGFYPATIGSGEKPAPSGTFKVRRGAWNPDYHYDPKFAWKGVKTNRPLTIRPGPNNPVGLIWIDLTAPSYGIHGTPDPEKIGKTASHGCIRLTNWDAVDLGQIVRRGTTVKFEDQDSPVASPSGLEARQSTTQPAANR